MSFSAGFLQFLVSGALAACALAALALIVMLILEWRQGRIWGFSPPLQSNR